MDYCRGRARVLVINDNYKLAPWADYHYFCDLKWIQWHEDMQFAGRRFTQDKDAANKYGIEYIESKQARGLSIDPAIIHQGGNSGYQALNLAYHLGAKRAVLLGYDMGIHNGKAHWFGEHPDKIRSSYQPWLENYRTVAEQLPSIGLEVINCSRMTYLDCFPRMSLASALSSGPDQA